MVASSVRGSQGDQPLGVLIVGPPAADTDALLKAFADAGFAAARSHDPEEIAHLVMKRHPDVVVPDLRNDDLLSNRILQWLGREGSTCALVITDLTEVETRLRVIEMDGVIDHLVAPFDPREATARVRVLLGRRNCEQRGRIKVGDLHVDIAQRSAERGGEWVPLTPREVDVLLILIENPGTPVAKRELLERIWRSEARSENVVEANVSSLRRKLHSIGPPLIHTVHGTGYVFRAVPASPMATRARLVAERDRLVRERNDMLDRRDDIIRRLQAERARRR